MVWDEGDRKGQGPGTPHPLIPSPYNDYGRILYRDSEVLVCEHGQDLLFARQCVLHLGCDGEVGWLAIVYVRFM